MKHKYKSQLKMKSEYKRQCNYFHRKAILDSRIKETIAKLRDGPLGPKGFPGPLGGSVGSSGHLRFFVIFRIFIGPSITWGLIYGSGCPSVRHLVQT